MSQMEQQHNTTESVSNAAAPETRTAAWVAPLKAIKTFSVAEFTQFEGNPGSDGTPTALS
ncbi:hypothetical protein [Elstera litoralis]|uniref:hypothetical protein n=1 Tax=Elstera litoralis TaxID=552518 RepID=UPI0012EE1919|nr:hypothetical protein [Elstera litoralis]